MAKKSIKKAVKKPSKGKGSSRWLRTMRFIAWISVLALWGCVGCSWVNPSVLRFFGVVGIAFPFFVASVILVLMVCLLFARRVVWVPLLGLAACFVPLRNYCPINLPSPAPKNAIKVMSYNTLGFGGKKRDADGHNIVASYIGKSGADIVCFQEGFGYTKTMYEEDIRKPSKERLVYCDTLRSKDHVVGCISRYPIVGKRHLNKALIPGCGEFLLLLGYNDTLRVLNCHLQSMGLSAEDRNDYHQMVIAPETAQVDSSSRRLISKISLASVKRAQQVDTIVHYLSENKGKNLLVCGDFNDTPISYAFNQVYKTGLTCAFTDSGNGIARTFNRDAIYVRIDHIFCSDQWKTYGCRVDTKAQGSDHYPIYAYLQRKK